VTERVPADWLRPDWQAPGIGALMTTRAGGVSRGRYASMNVGMAVGDDPAAVAENRARLAAALGAAPVFLAQQHGTRVVQIGAADLDTAPQAADASITTEPGIACVIQVADCLPVLLAAPGRRAVGAAHAGWRGLCAGVLEATLQALCAATGCRPREVEAWIGPGIGPRRFEVGPDVLQAFAAAGDAADAERFRPLGGDKWLADLPRLARDRLQRGGVRRIGGGTWCTASDTSRFFSFRRDGVTGRMAAVVWIER
jgi:YfiH family protein